MLACWANGAVQVLDFLGVFLGYVPDVNEGRGDGLPWAFMRRHCHLASQKLEIASVPEVDHRVLCVHRGIKLDEIGLDRREALDVIDAKDHSRIVLEASVEVWAKLLAVNLFEPANHPIWGFSQLGQWPSRGHIVLLCTQMMGVRQHSSQCHVTVK